MRLSHDEKGPLGAPTVVFLGSLGTTTSLWRPQMQALSPQFRMVCLDLPGHGGSDIRLAPFGIENIADDVLQTLDGLGISQTSFVGLSIGGMVGQRLAGQSPDRIDRLAVLFSAASVPEPQAFRDRATDVRRRGSTAHLLPTLLSRWFTADYRATHTSEVQWVGRMLSGISAEGYAGCAEALAEADLRSGLAQVLVPTLVVGGAQDTALPVSLSREVADGIPHARFVKLDPAAHLGNIERANSVNALLGDFLAG